MTAIVGLIRDGSVWIGADRETTWGYTKQSWGSKIVEKGGLVFAWTGLAAVKAVVRDAWQPPEVPEDPSRHDHWFRVTMPRSIMEAVKESGISVDPDSMKNPGCGIVGWRGRLGSLCPYWTIAEPEAGVCGFGSGGEVALGALYALRESDPEHAVRVAVEAASVFSTGVGCGVDVVKVPDAPDYSKRASA
jgi:hypothetical protein